MVSPGPAGPSQTSIAAPSPEAVAAAPPVEPPAGSAATVLPPPTTPPPTEPINPNSTQNSLHISEIRDGLVIMNDGTFRAVVMCQSINFDLMSPSEKEAVEYSYQGFLNSLYFPIQIFIRSQKIDLAPYLDKLQKLRAQQESMLLGVLMDDYIGFLDEISAQTNIMDKKFYVVIGYPDANADIRRALKTSAGFFTGLMGLFRPAKTVPHVVIDENALEKARTELRNRVNAVMQGLNQCGVQSVPLDTQELIELFYEAYNPDTAVNQRLGDSKDLNVPMIRKGQGQAAQPQAGGTA
ncbi:hypothetical protein A3F65_02580 [Candidatus Saccharibacteria bacterium RIFCSPHIGHO2_12_FULL_47_16b]|nr:MAG: hypothetical protein A3F65_02580 [Candidatus Saccharibacteria bacterium RIFCSPHIGHO2_12_FULL_47_16b]